jgi:PKD repeat protein
MKKNYLSIIGAILLSSSAFSQSQTFDATNARDGESVEYCITHKKRNELLQNPQAVASFAQDELIRQQELQNAPYSEKAVVYIPIVFHIIHNGGNENISNEQVMDAFSILNRDFRLNNADAANVHADFATLPSDVQIEFRLATKAPNGVCFNGITRTQNAITSNGANGDDQVNAVRNGNNVYQGNWPSDKYLNIYIVAEAGGAAGYTMTPYSFGGNDMYKGIWILHGYVGSMGTASSTTSRALTHEVGHWLNLDHTWGGNNNPGNASSCSTDDAVTDTPNTIGVTSCNLNEATCGPRANVENYMDYSYCSKMYTPLQGTRMRSALSSSIGGRNNLKTAQNLIDTGADGVMILCKAEFSSDKSSVCAGTVIQFTDESYNATSGWTWTFTGGTPSSSTSQNPSITYSTPGTYAVTLVATDGPSSDTETKTGYIHVVPVAANIPLLEGFESYSTLNGIEEWGVINPSGNGFELATSTGLNSSKSARIMNYGQTAGDIDELVSSPVDLSNESQITLSFRYAHKRRNTSDDDKLRVLVTNTCGDSWAIRKTLLLSTLSEVQGTTFTPAAESDWTTVHVTNITASYFVDNFRYKFTFESGGGNNLFIDNINIYAGGSSDEIVTGTSGVSELESINGLSVYPNPTDKELTVDFNVHMAQEVMVTIQDVSGKITQRNVINANEGSNLVLMNTQSLASGIYFLEVKTSGARQVLQFVVK